MKLFLGLLALLIATPVKAEPPIIWGANQTARLLEHNLNFNQTVSVLTGPATPTSTAQNAPKGSHYMSTNGTTYVKQDAGSSTNWNPILDNKTGWTTTGNAGLNNSTHFVGTTDAIDLIFKTNGSQALRIDSSQKIGFGTTPSDKFHFKWASDAELLLLEGSGAGTYHQWQILAGSTGYLNFTNSDNTSFRHLSLSGPDGYTGFGMLPDYKIHIVKSSTDTAPSNVALSAPLVVVQNSSATTNNWSGLAFQNSNAITIDSLIAGVHENQTSVGGQTGRLGLFTANAGTISEALRINSSKTVEVMAAALSLDNNVINNVANPVSAQDAVNKRWILQDAGLSVPITVTVGGTGQTTLTSNGLLYGNGTSAVSNTGAGSLYQVITANASSVPTYGAVNLAQDAAVTSQLGVTHGGTGASTLTANNVILGNGTSAVQFVAPGTSGNLLTSNGSTWQSTAPAAAGVLTVATKTTHYTITTSDNVILANGATGGFVLTLPAASSSSGYLFRVMKIDSTNSTITIAAAGSDLIKTGNPLSGENILVLSDPGDEINIISNGSVFYAF